MNYTKRAFYSLRHYWLRNLLITFLFTALFTACVGSIVLYKTSQAGLQSMQETVKNSVSLRHIYVWNKADNASFNAMLSQDELDAFADSTHITGYNYASYYMGDLEGAKPLYPEERKENERQWPGFDVWLYCPKASQVDRAFTMGGFHLAEGRHFTEDETHVCLVSREFADYNGFTLGSHFSFVDSVGQKDTSPQDLEIVGIFQGPDSEQAKGIGATPEEMIMTPSRFIEETYSHLTARCVQAFCKTQEERDAFVNELEQKFNITQVVDSPMGIPSMQPVPEEYGGMRLEEVVEAIQAEPRFVLEYEQQLYDMTAEPMEKMGSLAGTMAAGFLVASALVLILSNMLFLKGKRQEFGMLCAMGESKGKLVLQAAIEMLTPVLLAMLLGMASGAAFGVPLAESLGGSVYTQNAADMQSQNDLVSYAHRAQDGYSRDRLYNPAALNLVNGFTHHVVSPPRPKAVVDSRAMAIYFCVVLGLAFLALLLQTTSILRLSPVQIMTGRNK